MLCDLDTIKAAIGGTLITIGSYISAIGEKILGIEDE